MRRRQDSRHSRSDEMRIIPPKQGHSYPHSRHLESHSESRSSSSRRHDSRHHTRVAYHTRDGFDRPVVYDDRCIPERSFEQNEVKRPHGAFSGKCGGMRNDTIGRGSWHLEEIHRLDPESFAERQTVWSVEPLEQWRHRRSFEVDERRHHKRSRSRSRDEPQDSRCHSVHGHGDVRSGWRRTPSQIFGHPFSEGREISDIYNDGDWHNGQQRQQRNGHLMERFEQREHRSGSNFREVARSRSRTPSQFRNSRNLAEDRFRVSEGYVEAVSPVDRPFIPNMPIEGPSNSHYRECDSRPSTFSVDRCTPQSQPNDRCYHENAELLPNIRQMVGGLDKYIAAEQGHPNEIGLSPAQKARARKLLEELLITVSGSMPSDISQADSSVKVEGPPHTDQLPVVGEPEEFFKDSNMWRGQDPVASSLVPNSSGDPSHYPTSMMDHHPPYNIKDDFKPGMSRLHRNHQRRRV